MDRSTRSASLVCQGIMAGQSLIPPFEVFPGQIVKLVFPPGNTPDMQLAEQRIRQELNRTSRASAVQLAEPLGWWRDVFQPQTAAQWLMTHAEMSRREAAEKLTRFQVNPDAILRELAGNPRWMLGFAAAMHHSPDVLVFTTTGCDPWGIQFALQTVQSELQGAAVYLTCNTSLAISEPNYAAVLEVQEAERKVA